MSKGSNRRRENTEAVRERWPLGPSKWDNVSPAPPDTLPVEEEVRVIEVPFTGAGRTPIPRPPL